MENPIVPVIIKAPNQKIDDLLVECDSNWTVHELKSHLSQVYPSKPHPNGQKLIYSGKLLMDDMIVNEVLKSYNGQQNNTIHLVCSLTRDNLPFGHKLSSCDNSTKVPEETCGPSFDSLPEREAGHINEAHEFKPIHVTCENDYRQIYYQRAYLMNTFMQYISQHINGSSPPQFFAYNEEPHQNVRNTVNNQPENEENVADEERPVNRDWLDWVYILSRLIVLSIVVYFYSSPVRCAMVTAMALILYHLGMFRLRQFPINNIFNNFNNNNQINNANEQEQGETPPQEQTVVNNREPQSVIDRFGWLNTIINFLFSFLLSLVPDNHEN